MQLFIFVGKKLISTDTILPIAMEFRRLNPGSKVTLVTPDQKTLQDIQKNKTLITYIDKNLSLIRLGGLSRNRFFSMIQRVKWVFDLIYIAYLTNLNLAKLIHFGTFEEWPRNFLVKKAKRNIFLFESNGWGTGKLEDSIDEIDKHRIIPEILDVKYSGQLVAFSDNWKVSTSPKNVDSPCLKVTPSKLWPAWVDFIHKTAPSQWRNECQQLGIAPDSKICFYVLGTLDALPSFGMGDGPIDDVVIQTLDLIYETDPHLTIIIKPHPITDNSRLQSLVKLAKSDKIYVSYLHPCVLAKYSIFAICNYYSTSMVDLWHNSVTTVEYSKYSEEGMEITNGGSMRPEYIDHFIELEDKCRLKALISEFLNTNNTEKRSRRYNSSLSKNDRDLMEKLSA